MNGSPPFAIPSSIGTLTATLYGDDPKKLPSLNYVRQCRVLVQVIGETITAMKLAACPDWAEIFFDSTRKDFSALMQLLTTLILLRLDLIEEFVLDDGGMHSENRLHGHCECQFFTFKD